jgi:glycosyltransferase involved in cell wall biosynthesis
MNVLFVLPSLAFGGAARQVTLLAGGLPREGFTRHVCVLGDAGPWAADLRARGVEVTVLGTPHPLDPRAVRGLWRVIRDSRPDILHAWRMPAVRLAVALAGGRLVVASWPCRGPHDGLGWLDRRLLGRCARVTVAGTAEAEHCRKLGLAADRIVTVPPGVVLEPTAAREAAGRQALGLPASARLIVGVGPLESAKGFRDAIWAFNILQGLYDELHLALLGDGPDEHRLRQFTRGVRSTGRVHFAGPRTDVAGWLADAELVWVPDRVGTSRNALLEAMAAGRPVVASRLAQSAEIVRDGETGLLVPASDRAALARQTRRVLDDGELRRRLGQAGRSRVEETYGAAELVRRFTELYDAVGGR